MEAQSKEALWYVVHTYSGYENKVMQDLKTTVENKNAQRPDERWAERICDVQVPVEMVPELKDGEERMVERKLYPGYVLVKMVMDDETWYTVRNVRGATGFVGPGSKPVALSPEEVESLGLELGDAQAPVSTAKVSVAFAVGDVVEITAGAMEGFTGTVEAIDLESMKVQLSVSMFGRKTPAELDIAQVAPLD